MAILQQVAFSKSRALNRKSVASSSSRPRGRQRDTSACIDLPASIVNDATVMEQPSSRPREAAVALGGPSLAPPEAQAKLPQLPTSSTPSGEALSSPTVAIVNKQNASTVPTTKDNQGILVKESTSSLDVTDLKGLRGISNKHRAFLLRGRFHLDCFWCSIHYDGTDKTFVSP